MKYLNSIRLVALSFLIVGGSGCVAKKKYLEMEAGKIRANKRVVALTKELDGVNEDMDVLRAEFNLLKNEWHGANAVKDRYIDSLNVQLVQVSTNSMQKDAALEDQIYAFKTEKRQLRSAIVERENRIASLTASVKTGEENLAALKKEVIELKFQVNNQKDKTTTKENALRVKNREMEKVSAQLRKYKSEVSELKSDLALQNEAVERLANQVKLLKNELAK